MEKEYSFFDGKTIFMDDRFFKLTTDTVLLSHFAQSKPRSRGLDLGAGCGFLGLLFMLRNPGVLVDGIEKVEGACALARKNYLHCGISPEQAQVIHGDYTDFHHPKKYDFCLSNPPYFSPKSGFSSTSSEIDTARRGEMLDVCRGARRALKTGGKFFLCLPPDRLGSATQALYECGFYIKRLRFVHDTVQSSANIVLLEASSGSQGMKIDPPLILRDENGYTKEYCEIYGSFAR